MTAEEEQKMRSEYRKMFASFCAHMGQIMPVPFQADASLLQLVEHLNELEKATSRLINARLARDLVFSSPLSVQNNLIDWVLAADLYLQNLHRLLATNIESIIEDSPDSDLKEAFRHLSRALIIDPPEVANVDNRPLLTKLRPIVLLHFYRAWIAGGLQKQLIQRLSGVFQVGDRTLELAARRLPDQAGVDTGATNVEASQGALPTVGYQQAAYLALVRNQLVDTLNEQLQQNACQARISHVDYHRLIGLMHNHNSGQSSANIAWTIPITMAEYHSPVNDDECIKRMLSGLIFVRPDKKPGYYGFHISIIHELIHVMHITEGTIISRGTDSNPFGMDNDIIADEWGASSTGGNCIEEFRTTFFDDFSEYKLVREMDILARMPYRCFILPLAMVHANQGNRNAIKEMQPPLETYMLQNGFLPSRPSERAGCIVS